MAVKKENMLKIVKDNIHLFYKDGDWVDDLETIQFRVNGTLLNVKELEFFKRLCKALVEVNFLSECTKIWLLSHQSTVLGAVKYYNSQVRETERINENTFGNEVRYDRDKLDNIFKSDTLLYLHTKYDEYIESFENKLSAIERKGTNDIEYKKSLNIKINKDSIKRELDQYEFAILLDTLTAYSKKEMKAIENMSTSKLTKDMAGYYNYLISSNNLTNEDKERLKQIRYALGLNED